MGVSLPTVDVAIPALDEELHIGRCLDAVASQDYPADRVRILVVDAGSRDATLERVRAHAAEDPRIVAIESPERLTTPQALNLALEHSQGELFARVDAHGWPLPGYLRRAAEVLLEEGPDVACVGGRAEPVAETRFGRALGLAWQSRFGVGGSVYAHEGGREDTSTVPWGMYRRAALDEVGGFDPAMIHGEDEELNWRLREAGKRVVLDGGIRFAYVIRASWGGVFHQYRNYGAARVRVLRKHRGFLRAHHLAPAAMVAAGTATAALATFSGAARRALVVEAATYAVAAGIAARQVARDEPTLIPDVMAAYAALHLGYGTGMLAEAARPRPRT